MPKTSWSRVLSGLIFPVLCVGCQKEGDWICLDCRRNLALHRPEQCVLCHKAAPGNGLCLVCQQRTRLDGVATLFHYQDPLVKSLVKTVKYGGYPDGVNSLATRYRQKLLARLPDSDWTATFAPLSKGSLAKRGFNQAELFARVIAGQDFPINRSFRKIKETANQAGLSKKERPTNLRGALSTQTQKQPEQIVIFDDVITTGATLSLLAKAARKRGAKQVWAATIAHD